MTDVHVPVVRDQRYGVMLMLVGIALFSIVNAVVKDLSTVFPVSQIVAFRNLAALIPILLMVRSMGGIAALRTERPGQQFAQAMMFLVAVFSTFFAFKLMPITDATAISFTQPLIVVALSAPLLKERVTALQWAAVAMGLAGVLLMTAPTGEGFNIGAVFASIGALASALAMLQLRALSATESSISILFWTMTISGVAVLPLLAFEWVTPTLPQLALLVGTGIACGLLQYMTTRALHFATAAAVAPTRYTSIVWAVLIDIAWFATIPTPTVLIGSAIVIGAAFLVLRR